MFKRFATIVLLCFVSMSFLLTGCNVENADNGVNNDTESKVENSEAVETVKPEPTQDVNDDQEIRIVDAEEFEILLTKSLAYQGQLTYERVNSMWAYELYLNQIEVQKLRNDCAPGRAADFPIEIVYDSDFLTDYFVRYHYEDARFKDTFFFTDFFMFDDVYVMVDYVKPGTVTSAEACHKEKYRPELTSIGAYDERVYVEFDLDYFENMDVFKLKQEYKGSIRQVIYNDTFMYSYNKNGDLIGLNFYYNGAFVEIDYIDDQGVSAPLSEIADSFEGFVSYLLNPTTMQIAGEAFETAVKNAQAAVK